MRVVKFTHSCVRVEDGDRALVIDPGSFSEDQPLEGAEAALITHEHFDHFDAEKLRRRDDLQVWTSAAVAAKLPDLGDRVHVVADGDTFAAAGFAVSVHGTLHEQIHPDLPRVPNVGFLVGDAFFHPGDAFTVLDHPVRAVLVPTCAPWLRGADSAAYIRAMAPALALAGHDGLLNDIGHRVFDGLLETMAGRAGSEFRHLAPGQSLQV